MNERGAVSLTDVIVAAAVIIAVIGITPVYYDLIAPVSAEADAFSALMLQLIVPSLFLGIIISIGVSARRREV